MHNFVTFVATAGYVGYFPFAPGTAGTLVGILVYLLFSFFPPSLYLLSAASLFIFGGWVAERAEMILGEKDSPRIVIDEIVGFLITMILIPCTPGNLIAGFIFFRLFDIIKPPPARRIDRRMKGGFAVILDDAVAGLYANLLLLLTLRWWPGVIFQVEQWIRLLL